MKPPLLLGHRGVRPVGLNRLTATLPQENSMQAFEYALAAGCDGFEFDVRLTRDGRQVLWHDPACEGRKIAQTDYVSLRDRNGKPLALLEDSLRQFAPRAYLDIEIKLPGHEESVLAALQACPPQRGYLISSFLPEVLVQLRSLSSDAPLGFICDRGENLSLRKKLPVQVVLPHFNLVTQDLIAEIHSRGLQVMSWTVNDPRRMRQLAAWGIDGLISDDPGLLYQTFHSR